MTRYCGWFGRIKGCLLAMERQVRTFDGAKYTTSCGYKEMKIFFKREVDYETVKPITAKHKE